MHIAAEEGHLSVIEVLFDFDAKADAETIVGIIQSIGMFSLNIYIFVLEEKKWWAYWIKRKKVAQAKKFITP